MANETIGNKYIPPSRLIGNLYFVGTYEASTHIIDTEDGLILIDPGYFENLNTVTDNIRQVGFQVSDIKYILISHAHLDHMDATEELVKLTNAETFIGRAELPLLLGEIFHFPIRSFTPDHLLDDKDTVTLGNTTVTCLSTPGHTDGTTSFFFDIKDGENTYRAGMFGGAGCNTLYKSFLSEHGLPFENRNKFLASVNKLLDEKVDVFIGNHVQNNNTDKKIAALPFSEKNPFIAPDEWQSFLLERKERITQIIKNNE